MADGTMKLLSEKVKDHLSHLQGLVGFISEKTNQTLPLIKSFLDHSAEKLQESRPLMKSSVNYWEERRSQADLYTKSFVGFTKDKVNEYVLPLSRKFMGFPEEREREKETLPWVKYFVGFAEEKIKQHPYLAVLVPLIVLWMCRSLVSLPKKMMKAPGRNFRMSRDDFVRSPKNYFRDLRAKKD